MEDSVRMFYDGKQDQPTGDCLLALTTAEDAVRAVSKLNGSNVAGHTVKMYIVPT